MEQRFKEIDSRLDRVEDRQDKLEGDLKRHEIEFAETKVYVKEIYKKMDSISIALEALKNATGSEWKGFFEKAFWLVSGAAVAFFAGKIHF